ncbi:hypothetical protein MHEI_46720 [Mycobacterium heidelbergense]|nr:hypothetical protein MHEI_46720 [Mycobacterium heidelbergense]
MSRFAAAGSGPEAVELGCLVDHSGGGTPSRMSYVDHKRAAMYRVWNMFCDKELNDIRRAGSWAAVVKEVGACPL